MDILTPGLVDLCLWAAGHLSRSVLLGRTSVMIEGYLWPSDVASRPPRGPQLPPTGSRNADHEHITEHDTLQVRPKVPDVGMPSCTAANLASVGGNAADILGVRSRGLEFDKVWEAAADDTRGVGQERRCDALQARGVGSGSPLSLSDNLT